MPNIQTPSFTPISLPATVEDFTFSFYAKSKRHETLVHVAHAHREFLLQIIERPNDYLIKAEKLTRVSPVSIMQDALAAFAKLHDLTLTYSNVSRQKNAIVKIDDFSILKDINYFVKNLSYEKDILIEVGFGSGRHLLYQAKKHPNKLIIGIEIHNPSIEQVIKQCKLQDINNVLIASFDARIFLQLLASNSVEKIFVHFPVPWDKKPHRRVISTSFIDESIRTLKPKGTLELRTDSENYFAYSFETFQTLTKSDLRIRKNYELPIVSKYEDRWRRQEKNIYDITLTNEEVSEPKEIVDTLTFDETVSFRDIQKRFENIIIRRDGHFVHFEDIYIIDQNSGLIKLTLGAYEKPEHKYLIFNENKIQYFPKETLPLTQNMKSHKIIKEFFHV